jgi:hypothetical protein
MLLGGNDMSDKFNVSVEEIKKTAEITPHMGMSADEIIRIVKERNEESDSPEHDKMQPWDIAFSESGMPIMAVPIHWHGKATVGYLSPFRGYRFQVSGNFEGQCDCGSTIVTDLKSYADAGDDAVLLMMAENAIYRANHFTEDENGQIYSKLSFKEIMHLDAYMAFVIAYLKLLDGSYRG